MLRLLIALFAFAVPIATSAVEYVEEPCEKNFAYQYYDQLVLDEPAVGAAFDKSVERAGTNKLTQCTIEYPQENGKSVPGNRRMRFHIDWYRTTYINGIAVPELQREGMAIQFNLRLTSTGGTIREVTGLGVCRTVELCEKMGIANP